MERIFKLNFWKFAWKNRKKTKNKNCLSLDTVKKNVERILGMTVVFIPLGPNRAAALSPRPKLLCKSKGLLRKKEKKKIQNWLKIAATLVFVWVLFQFNLA